MPPTPGTPQPLFRELSSRSFSGAGWPRISLSSSCVWTCLFGSQSVGFAESDFLSPHIGKAPCGCPLPHPPCISPLSRPLLERITRPQRSARGPGEKSGPQSPQSFWPAPLTHGSGKSVVPRAEYGAGQWELAPGDTWGPCWLVVKS